MDLSFIIPGHVVPWGRARFSSKTRKIQKGFFKDPKVARFQDDIVTYARLAGLKKIPFGPVSITVIAIYRAPIRPSRGKSCELGDPYLNVPDIDNIGKVVLDALNHIAFEDDRQVSSFAAMKIYGHEDSMTVKISDRHIIR